MSVESEILRIQHNIASAYAKVAEKGGEVPSQPTSAKLAAAVASIPAGGSSGGVPVGTIVIWSGTADNIPAGWQLCDGTNGTPDLRDKFVLGAGTSHAVGETGGSEEVTLTVEQMPTHSHTLVNSGFLSSHTTTSAKPPSSGAYNSNMMQGARDFSLKGSGASQPHPNMPPYYALCYIIKTAEDSGGGNITAGDGLSKEGDTLSVTTPVRGIVTHAEFDALTEAQKNSGLYVISDGGGGGGSGEESTGEIYSTEETRIGTWIDGKPLYRMIVEGTTGTTANAENTVYSIPGSAIIPTNLYGMCVFNNEVRMPINCEYATNNGVACIMKSNTIITLPKHSNYCNQYICIIVEYTKTTDEGGTT